MVRDAGAKVGEGVKIDTFNVHGDMSLLTLGDNVVIHRGVTLHVAAPLEIGSDSTIRENITIAPAHGRKEYPPSKIGSHVFLGPNSIIDLTGGLEIGDYTLMGDYLIIETHDHQMARSQLIQAQDIKPITGTSIGRDVFAGANCMVLPGVKVAEGAVIGGGAVVTKDVEPYTIVAGVPAKKIGERK